MKTTTIAMKKFCLAAILLFTGTLIFAQPYFNRNIITVTQDNEGITGDLSFADIDGDGDLDVVASMDWKLAWFENLDGMGNYGSQNYITNDLRSATSVVAADFDGDGDLDLLSSSVSGDNGLAWFENLDGLGTFGDVQLIDSIQTSRSLAADFDYDGDLDVIAVNISDAKVYKNTDANGTFDTGTIIADIWAGTDLDVNDINGDGFLDVISSSGDLQEIIWLENLGGTGNFGPKQVLSETQDYFLSTSSGDLDGDGDIDIISGDYDGIKAYENLNGLGTFGNMDVLSNPLGGYLRDIQIIDIDQDGDMDVFFATKKIVAWLQNVDGLGTFSIPIQLYQINSFSTYFDIVDANSDGDLDVVMAANYRITLFDNDNGNENYVIKDELYINTLAANKIITYDIDNDGDQDVIVGDGSQISLFKNVDGLGEFNDQIVISHNNQGVYSLYLSDLDGDGDMDLLSSSNGATVSSGKFSWYENLDGQGDFGPRQVIYNNISSAWRIMASDLDGDGDKDVICLTSTLNAGIHWFENTNGLGEFEYRENLIQDASWPFTLIVNDLDNDGDHDILAGRKNDIVLIKNINAGSNQWEWNYLNANEIEYVRTMKIADLDLDGNSDLILGGTDGLGYFSNIDINGNFTEFSQVGSALDISEITVADLDGDGDLDLASTSYWTSDVIWYENEDGNGGFSSNILISDVERWSRSIFSADINGDNKMDILTTAAYRGRVSWFENSDVLSIGNITLEGFVIYPNPTSGILNIKHPFPIDSVTIYNQLGQRVRWFSSEASIDLSNLDSGLYFIEIVDDQQNIAVKRVIKT